MVIRGLDGERVLGMPDFYRGPYRTAVGDAEMLVEIRVPLAEATGSAYAKVDRRVGDWAVAAAGASVTLSRGKIARAGVALAAVGSAGDLQRCRAGAGRPGAVRRAVRPGRRVGGRVVLPGHRSARLRRNTSGTWPAC